ncbi:MAG: histidine--tRNA ligase [Deltaproteobacteria bacterium]|nr:histidine--tRNA ligase [Deltaproteobacteria bacterium]MBK8234905.1 histidine--tRNA ligase [Deltaproteobacteria bacterium]MBK8719776.1 histidine--tRNA ligase [Deltaproteobacteria bacterium]MBP7285248.1 histidine--tRNA ligase [Nannocystaceae bacterium]
MAISTKPPSGMRDYLPADLARRNHVVGIVREVYQRYGFVPLETPAIENLEILLGKYGEDEKLVYRLLHRGEVLQRALAEPASLSADALSDQALRYDLTVPLARVVAQYGELPKYFKRYQIQPVWRADRPGKGRFREFYQCDVDITGTESQLAEAEVCAAACDVLDRLGFDDYTLCVNHRALLRGVIRAAGIDPAQEGTALQAVDKLAKIGRDAVIAELVERGIAAQAGARLIELIDRPADEADAARFDATAIALADDEARAALSGLRELFALLAVTSAGRRARFDPSLARGLGYYTGPIFEIQVADLAGSLAGGGRYDELVGIFGKRRVPAVGLSLGLERILVVMGERGMYPPLAIGPELMLCWLDVEPAEVLAVAAKLRAQGLRVEVFPEAAKLGRQLQYADAPGVGARWCGILGKDELARGELTLKHLASGDQTAVAVDRVAAHLTSS